jgi:TRAP-type C4-dicarboxylate transport system substrate-binding protein
MSINKNSVAKVLVAILAVAVAGCASNSSGADKSGGPAAPHSLRVGTVEDDHMSYAPEVKAFANSVSALSNGALKVDVVWAAPGPYTPNSERKLAEMVTSGDIDLAVVPTRIWSKVNVTTMEAMQFPFLIDSVELFNKVVSGDIAHQMLAGLDQVGDKGLAIWPDSLRHPIGFFKPLLTAADFAGQRLRTPPSNVVDQLLTALGAVPVDLTVNDEAIPGKLDGADSAFESGFDLPRFGTFTGNVTLYPKANAIVANGKVFSSLSPGEQRVLQRAATDTVTFGVKSKGTEHDLAMAYCAGGGSVALASDNEVAKLIDRAAPLSHQLEANAENKRIIDEIRTLKAATTTTPADAAPSCQPASAKIQVTTALEAFPEGTYRTDSPWDGVVTMTYLNGVWQRIKADGTLDCAATIQVSAGRIYLTTSTDPSLDCGNTPGLRFLDAAWTLQGDQLRFVDINSDPNAIKEFSLPWTKIA